MSNVVPGDVFLVPIGRRQYCPVKVLYVSEYFKNVMLVGAYKAIVDAKVMPQRLPRSFGATIYSVVRGAEKDGKWIKVGTKPVLAREKRLSTRIVGGDVWVEDTCLGPPSLEERKTLPRMRICLGFDGVKDDIKEMLATLLKQPTNQKKSGQKDSGRSTKVTSAKRSDTKAKKSPSAKKAKKSRTETKGRQGKSAQKK
jgi:hypothetical protein